VLDFSQMMLGPWGTQIMADLGADVLKVERPDGGDWERSLASMGQFLDGESPLFLAMNRNKRSLSVDLKDPSGKELVLRLASEADIIVENYRPGVMSRLGLGYNDLKAVNSRLIYASGSGYGQSGPYVGRPGQDLLIQAMSGVMSHTGTETSPPTSAGTSFIDASTALMLVVGILAALRHRDRTGEGQRVDVSLFGTAIALQCQELSAFQNLRTDWSRSPHAGVSQPWLSAPYGTFPTSDGHMVISMAPLRLVADALDLPQLLHLAGDDKVAFLRREWIAEQIAERVSSNTTGHWVSYLTDKGLWVAPVNNFDQLVQDPQVQALGLLQTIDWHGRELHVVRTPIDLSETPVSIRAAPPSVGEQNSDVRAGRHWAER
tara:strand:+ start:30102 stop:31229 length:1128 start_codon:yes stop_codon:yes gene_type:complete